jgi:4-carboxymuconolactone decarboxylase
MSRIPQLTRSQLDGPQMEVFNAIAAGARGGVRGPFTVLLHSAELARRVEQLGLYCRFQCRVPERQRELAICLVAARWRADYEWYAHSSLAAKQGIPQDVLDAIGAGDRPVLADPADEIVYEFASELLGSGRVSDKTFAAAIRLLGEPGAVDLTGLLGYYTLLAMTLNVFEVDVPEDATIPWSGRDATSD